MREEMSVCGRGAAIFANRGTPSGTSAAVHGVRSALCVAAFAVALSGMWSLAPRSASAVEPDMAGPANTTEPRVAGPASAAERGMVGPASAAEEPGASEPGAAGRGYSLTPSITEPYARCPQPTAGHPECMAIVIPPTAARPRAPLSANPTGIAGQGFGPAGSFSGSGEGGGLAPADLVSAYRLPTTGGSQQTVAIVDAYDDPNAEKDLSVYRSHYGLGACTTAGGCFMKVNQTGQTKYPVGEDGWAGEISLDLDMVSAACPSCHILLVEAATAEHADLGAAENEAAVYKLSQLKTTAISDSWGGPERAEETTEDKYYNHPGIPIAVAAGDTNFLVNYPATSQYVISVGGTVLYKTPFYERGWFEEAWYDTGSGCSVYETKPPWQSDTGCAKRTNTDVSAVASLESPVSVYDSYGEPGWVLYGGTSVAAPIVAATEALSSAATRTEGAATFYKHPELLFDVTTGHNWGANSPFEGVCNAEYPCVAGPGYDGPTGNGTPDMDGAGKGSLENWSTVPVASRPGRGNSVSCPSSTWCLAVSQAGGYPAAATWNGAKWTPLTTGVARPSGGTSITLADLSCSSSSACTAVGSYVNSASATVPLAESWNGKSWTVQSTPNAAEASSPSSLKGVSCASSTSCIAVGSYRTTSSAVVILTEIWDGKAWTVQSAPNPGAKESELLDVSCTSSTACVAGGDYGIAGGWTAATIESWNGAEWTVQEPPLPTHTTSSRLYSVSCSAANACTAIGSFYIVGVEYATLAERWNGKEWSRQTIPTRAESFGTFLEAVSCASATSCEAVGHFDIGSGEPYTAVTAEHWNGTAWSIDEITASTSLENFLYGVSCASSSACVAVGWFEPPEYFPYHNKISSLTYSFDGTSWTPQVMSSAEGGRAVSCASATACTAVGHASGEGESPADIWNGAVWADWPTTRPAGAGGIHLAGVSCVSATECTAVGSYANSAGTEVTLAQHMTKANVGFEPPKWSVQSSPNPKEAKESSLLDVSCIASGSCMAVGAYTNGSGTTLPLVERLNGTEWALGEAATPTGAKESYLLGASCVSSSACTAVGDYSGGTGSGMLAEGWNGKEWASQTVPAPSGVKVSALRKVSCASSSLCIAVGDYVNSSGTYVALAESWNGKEWAVQTPPNPSGATQTELRAVSCTSTSSCTAVGHYEATGKQHTLAEIWNGKEWTIHTTPDPEEAKQVELTGVSCFSATLCAAIGYSTNASGTEEYLSEMFA